MKKERVITLVMALAVGMTLAACGKSASTDEATGKTSVREEKGEDDAEKEDNSNSQTPVFKTDATIEPTVLVDQDGIRITADELNYVGNNPQLSLTLENNTDKKLSFHSGTLGFDMNAVNGYMMPGIFINSDVAPGNKAKETVELDYEELLMLGLDEIAELDIAFQVEDEKLNNVLTTDPLQIKTSAFGTYDQSKDTFRDVIEDGSYLESFGVDKKYYSEEVLYDDGGVKVDAAFGFVNQSGDWVLALEGYNSGSGMLLLSLSDIEANGIVASEGRWTSQAIAGGKHAVLFLTLNDALDYQNSGISAEDVAELKFKLELLNMDLDSVASEKECSIMLGDGSVTADTSGEEVYNENGVRIVFRGMTTEEDDARFAFYVENTTGKNIELNVDSRSINGYMADDFNYVSIENGKTGVLDDKIYSYELEGLGLKNTDISKAEFTFEIQDDDYNDIAKPVIQLTIEK